MKSLKIAVLIDELVPGSAPKVVGQTVKGLNKLGHQCEALVYIDNDKADDKICKCHLEGIKIRYLLGKRPWWDFKFPGFAFFSLHHLLGFFLISSLPEYDIVIANTITSIFAAWGLKLFKKIPYIFYIHCDPNIWLLDKLAIKFANASIVSGKLHKQRFAKIENKNLQMLVLGCFPMEEFISYDKREKAVIIFDRWDIGNNPGKFLAELISLDKRDYKIKIGGIWHPVELKFEFMERVANTSLHNKIEFLGALDEDGIKKECSKVVLHYHHNQEAFGMSTLEAAACGCCIIIPDGSGVADLFSCIHDSSYLNMKNVAQYFGKMNWEIAKQYTWDNYAKNLERIIQCAI